MLKEPVELSQFSRFRWSQPLTYQTRTVLMSMLEHFSLGVCTTRDYLLATLTLGRLKVTQSFFFKLTCPVFLGAIVGPRRASQKLREKKSVVTCKLGDGTWGLLLLFPFTFIYF